MVGDEGTPVKHGLDPRERALLRTGNPDDAESPEEQARVTTVAAGLPAAIDSTTDGWADCYANVSAHLHEAAPLAVTADQAREVIRVLDAAMRSAASGEVMER